MPKDVIFRYSYILYIYTYAVFLPKSTLVCGSLQGLNTKYVIMLEPDNTVPLGIIMDFCHVLQFAALGKVQHMAKLFSPMLDYVM